MGNRPFGCPWSADYQAGLPLSSLVTTSHLAPQVLKASEHLGPGRPRDAGKRNMAPDARDWT